MPTDIFDLVERLTPSWRWAYHALRDDTLDTVLREGLRPQEPREDSPETQVDDPATYFCPTLKLAQQHGSDIVRFAWPSDAEEDEAGDTMIFPNGKISRTQWYTRETIPADQLQLVTPPAG